MPQFDRIGKFWIGQDPPPIATSKTAQAFTPFHFFGYSNFFGFYHKQIFITARLNFILLSLENITHNSITLTISMSSIVIIVIAVIVVSVVIVVIIVSSDRSSYTDDGLSNS